MYLHVPEVLNECLDLETAPEYGFPQAYALQPWRRLEGSAKVTCVALGRSNGQSMLGTTEAEFAQIVESRRGKPTVGWNIQFDATWLIAYGLYEAVNAVPWFDAMLLWKWHENGVLKERMPKWSLADGAKRWLKDWEHLPAFLELKRSEEQAGVNDAYWQLRAKLDTVATAMIAERIWAKLSPKKRRAATIEAYCTVPLARSWLMGVHMNHERARDAEPEIVKEMREIEQDIQATKEQLASPQQLGNLLFNLWGIEPEPGFLTDKTKDLPPDQQKISTDKKHLTYLAEKDDRVLKLLRWRELSVRYSKFIKAPFEAANYLGSNVVHPSPKIFSTYTGRMTYTSKTDGKYQTGVALHQWQRNKSVRALIEPPPGYVLVEFDASGQEDRLMALESQDPMLLKIFRDDMDVHCYTAANITGVGYEELMRRKAEEDEWVVGGKGVRQAGKVTNHSNKYRIGAKKMRIMAKVDYGLDITIEDAKRWQTGFKRGFPGVPRYWSNSIERAKQLGYAETIAGRTFLTPGAFFESKKDRWSVESSAINFRIQGAGGDMKELAIATLHQEFPDFLFAFDLHDGLFYYVKQGTPVARLRQAKARLDQLDYEQAWDYVPSIPMTWDGEFGPDWGHMTSLSKATQEYI